MSEPAALADRLKGLPPDGERALVAAIAHAQSRARLSDKPVPVLVRLVAYPDGRLAAEVTQRFGPV